jgi:hypothetical protein
VDSDRAGARAGAVPGPIRGAIAGAAIVGALAIGVALESTVARPGPAETAARSLAARSATAGNDSSTKPVVPNDPATFEPPALRPIPKLVTYADMALGISVDLPETWHRDQLSPRTLTIGGGKLQIAVADAQGVLTLCDPVCRRVAADDLRRLERAVFTPGRSDIDVGDTTLSGARARYQVDRAPESPSYHVIAIVDGRAVSLWFDHSDPEVDAAVTDPIIESFRYLRPTRNRIVDGVLLGPGFELPLPDGWGTGRRGSPTVTVSVGDAAGHAWTCRWSGWGSRTVPCAVDEGSTLEELIEGSAVLIWGRVHDVLLDHEPATIVSGISGYEYPARGGQYLAYVFAVHDGRPYVIRLWNPEATGLPIEEIVDAFRFTE